MKIILSNLRIRIEGPMMLYCDNKAEINIVHNPVQYDRTKHVEIDRHLIKKKLQSRLVCTPYIPSHCHLADVMTKGLSSSKFQDLISKLGMKNFFAPT